MGKKWSVEGDPTSEFIYIDKMSSREVIVYIANKYRDLILSKDKFGREDYHKIAEEFGLTDRDIYMYFTYRLGINNFNHKLNKLEYYSSDLTEAKKLEKKKEKILKEQVFYDSFCLWKVLAYNCKYYSYKKAKSVLKSLLNLHHSHKANGWTTEIRIRLQEIFTPMFFPKDNYYFAHIMACGIIKRGKRRGIYKAKLAESGQKESVLFTFENHYNPECLVILNSEEDCHKIDKIMDEGGVPLVIGTRENPKRNIINNIIEIKKLK